MLFESIGLTTPVDPINISFVNLDKVATRSHLNKLVWLHHDRMLHVQESTNPMG
jgi:hypothetical protein